MNDGDLVLTVAGRKLSGWLEVRLTRGIERCPSDFNIAMTERFPGESDAMVVKPGDACSIALGGDLVLTGYVDRVMPSISAKRHEIRIIGRGKCQDLVDCSAEWPGGQITGDLVLGIAKKLAQPYGITVSSDVDTGATIPQFNMMVGESPYEIIERLCRWKGLLAYEKPDGNLFLTQAGSDRAASGLAQGKNVQDAAATYAMDGRYSTVNCFLQSMDVLVDNGEGGNILATETDPGVPRHRQLDIICEAGAGGLDIGKKRAVWEIARRGGRGFQISVTCDSWRDGSGALWQPNTIVPVDLPALKVPGFDWLIGEVTYSRGEDGTRAELLLMPKAAFLPEPFLLQPRQVDVPPVAGQQ